MLSFHQFLALLLIKSCRYFLLSTSSMHKFYKYQNTWKLTQAFFIMNFSFCSTLRRYQSMPASSRILFLILCLAHITPPAFSAVSDTNFLVPPPKSCYIPTSDQIILLNSIFKMFIFQVGTFMLSPILSLPLCRSSP